MEDNTFNFGRSTLEQFANRVLDLARQYGATSAETEISEGLGQNVTVRLAQVETIEYHQDKSVSVTAYIGHQKGHASTSDFSDQALADVVLAAVNIARYTAQDPYAGLADATLLANHVPDLSLFHPWELPVESAIELAKECESAARGVDSRISNSEGATVSTQATQFIYANSHGFCQGFASTCHSLSAAVVAGEGTAMQRDYWYSTARHPSNLETAVDVGCRAGTRTVQRLGGKRLKTGQYPVLFETGVASSLLGHLVAAISGGNLYRKSSFLLESLKQPVFSPNVTIDEDPFLLRGLASTAFDSEGVATQGRRLVDKGVLQGYFLSSYSARKLGMRSTGNAGGAHNLIVGSTGQSFDELLVQMDTGLLVTELMGQGVNIVTGDYSRGAAGFWVEHGAIAWPVEEITIAGNLRDMYRCITAIGNDVLTRSHTLTGSILLDSMTVAGED